MNANEFYSSDLRAAWNWAHHENQKADIRALVVRAWFAARREEMRKGANATRVWSEMHSVLMLTLKAQKIDLETYREVVDAS